MLGLVCFNTELPHCKTEVSLTSKKKKKEHFITFMLLDMGFIVTIYTAMVTQFLVSIVKESHKIHYIGFVSPVQLGNSTQIM
jgi:hypothetical protein